MNEKEYNQLRSKYFDSILYEPFKQNDPILICENIGTGFGKSYGVLDKYLKLVSNDLKKSNVKSALDLSNSGFTNFWFTTPQKNQISLDKELIDYSDELGVRKVYVYAEGDLKELDFQGYLNGIKKTNLDRYNDWVNTLLKDRKSIYISNAKRIRDNINKVLEYTHRIVNEDIEKNERDRIEREIEVSKKEILNLFRKIIEQKLNISAIGINMQEGDRVFATVKNLLDSKREEDLLFADLVQYFMPINIGLLSPTIFLSTSDKFIKSFSTIGVNKSKPHNLIRRDLDAESLIGNKREIKNQSNLYLSKSNQTQINYIKGREGFFEESNYWSYPSRGINFIIVLDEEHEVYDKMLQKCIKDVIDDKTTVSYLLSTICDIYEQVQEQRKLDSISEEERLLYIDTEYSEFHKEKEQLIASIVLNYEKCFPKQRFSGFEGLGFLLRPFRENIDRIEVSENEKSQIARITENVFSFSQKIFISKGELENIRFADERMRKRKGRASLYYSSEGKENPDPSLNDFIKLLLSVAISVIDKKIMTDDFKKWLKKEVKDEENGKKEGDNRGGSLVNFSDRVNNNKDTILGVFEAKIEEENVLIDYYLTYFCPKLIFKMEKMKTTGITKDAIRKIYVDFKIDLITELPEIKILRLLEGTKNKIVTLSATSGIKHHYADQFSREFMRRFIGMFSIKMKEFSDEELLMVERMRDFRLQNRNVHFNIYDDVGLFPETEESQVLNNRCLDFKSRIDNTTISYNLLGSKETLVDDLKEGAFADRVRYESLMKSSDAIFSAISQDQDAIILSIRNLMIKVLDSWAKEVLRSENKYKQFRVLNEEEIEVSHKSNSVKSGLVKGFEFEIGKKKIRIILFDAKRGRDYRLKEWCKKKSDNEHIVIISSIKSAGTGLNFITNNVQLEEEKDFNRLTLIDHIFYSSIFGKDKQDHWSSKNCLILMKSIAEGKTEVTLDEFKKNLNTRGNEILQEVDSIVKLLTVIQFIGRGERRDSTMETQVDLMEETLMLALGVFYRQSSLDDEWLLKLSMLNYEFLNYCKRVEKRISFQSEEERLKFTQSIDETSFNAWVFTNEKMPNFIRETRSDNESKRVLYRNFNEAFRDKHCFIDPEIYIENLKLNFPKIVSYINSFYVNTEDLSVENIYFYVTNIVRKNQFDEQFKFLSLSDINDKNKDSRNRVYNPTEILFGGITSTRYSDDPILNKITNIIDGWKKKTKDKFNKYVPNPNFIHHIKGNIGEALVHKVIELYQSELDISHNKIISYNELDSVLDYRLYEQFDIYIEQQSELLGKRLICVDVKNWSRNISDPSRHIDATGNAHKKASKIQRLTKGLGYKQILFFYINSRHEDNEHKIEQNTHELNDNRVYFLNLFESDPYRNNQNINELFKRKVIYGE
jgi:hypothetical protein